MQQDHGGSHRNKIAQIIRGALAALAQLGDFETEAEQIHTLAEPTRDWQRK
jgi:hypothetical protein